MQGCNATRWQAWRSSHKAQEPPLVSSIKLSQDVHEVSDGCAGSSVAVVKLDGVSQSLYSPLLTSTAHHGLNFILKEAFEGVQGKDLVEPSPAGCISCQGAVTINT